jgi:type VI secretion system protein ImpJ
VSSLKPIRWKEGMFLRPQHLQQFELFLESRENNRLKTLENHSWGLAHLKVRTEALENYNFDAAELQAVLSDGTLVSVPDNGRLPMRSFESFLVESGKPLTVYLGVRAREERRPQVLQEAEGQSTSRFMSVEQDVYDLDAGEGRAPIEFLEFDVRLFFGNESQQGYEILPLSQVVGTGDPAQPVMINRSFAPPSLTLHGSPALHDCARAVLDRLGVVQRELGGLRNQGDVDTLILYAAVSGYQPVLKDMVHDGMVHPRRVYQELARLAGALFYREKTGRSADEILPYDHRNPGQVFEHLRNLINELSVLAIKRKYQTFEMVHTAGSDDFQVELPQEARTPGARCFLEVLANESTHLVGIKMSAAIISSASRIPELKGFALLGLPKEQLPGAPPEVGLGAKGTFYRLKQEHEDWLNYVVSAGNLAVAIRDVPADFQVNLIVIEAD